ncbi:MAG: DoxX family protein [bacterium]|nr:DoxX family protein [bacterium]
MFDLPLIFNDWAWLILRVVFGIVFVAHGKRKLFGGLPSTAQFFASIGLKPAKFWAIIVGLTEFFGGILVILGLFTQWAALLLGVVMLVAMLKVKLKKGFIDGYEFDLLLLACAIALFVLGGGKVSLDQQLFSR